MKSKLASFFVLSTVIILIAGNSAYAQDASFPDYEALESERERLDREKIIYSPGEGDVRYVPKLTIDPKNPTSATPKSDTAATRTVVPAMNPAPTRIKQEHGPKPPGKPQPPKEDDDAILSFNFLYYIIQKYKLQDIVE